MEWCAMGWQYSGGVSRGGEPYATAEHHPSDDGGDAPEGKDDAYDEDYHDYDPNRWRWIAAVAGGILVLAVVATAVLVNSGDGASTSAKVIPPASRPAFTPPVKAPNPSLPRETVSTLTPSVSPTSTAQAAAPPPSETDVPPLPTPTVDPRTVVYTVSGERRPGDLVTVTYTDETGAFRTDLNVALPWTKTVIAPATVLLNSVTAASFASQLNCTITDAAGETVASQNLNLIATTCNR
jgi:hypothetical protein